MKDSTNVTVTKNKNIIVYLNKIARDNQLRAVFLKGEKYAAKQ